MNSTFRPLFSLTFNSVDCRKKCKHTVKNLTLASFELAHFDGCFAMERNGKNKEGNGWFADKFWLVASAVHALTVELPCSSVLNLAFAQYNSEWFVTLRAVKETDFELHLLA